MKLKQDKTIQQNNKTLMQNKKNWREQFYFKYNKYMTKEKWKNT